MRYWYTLLAMGTMMIGSAINVSAAEKPVAQKTIVIVAAQDGSAAWKQKADYICDGEDDQLEITKALNDLPETGGTVLLSDGTFICSNMVKLRRNSILEGQGMDTTILKFPNSPDLGTQPREVIEGTDIHRQVTPTGIYVVTDAEYVTLKDFQITGKGRIYISTSHNKLENVKAYKLDNCYMACIMIYPGNKFIEDIKLVNCQAVDCNRWGFVHLGEGAQFAFGVKDITYENCLAINCGKYDQYYGERHQHSKAWDVGFDIMEMPGGVAENVTYINCVADGQWETGFYVEAKSTECRNVRFINCISRNNGRDKQKKVGAEFGAGWIVAKGMYLENCISENNINGYHCSDRGGVFIGCQDYASNTGFLILLVSTSITLTNCAVSDAERPVYIWTGNTRDVLIEGMNISSSKQRTGAGITIEKLARDPGEITINNTQIAGYKIGIENRASAKGKPTVSNVNVIGAETNFIQCNLSGQKETIRIDKPIHLAVVSGKIQIVSSIDMPSTAIKSIKQSVIPASIDKSLDNAGIVIYNGSAFPYNTVFDTLQVEDGSYNIILTVEMADGHTVSDSVTIRIKNYDVVVDELERPLQLNYAGALDRRKTWAQSSGWEYANGDVFGDADCLVRKSNTTEYLTWNANSIQAYEIDVYSKTQNIANIVRIDISCDEKTWLDVNDATQNIESITNEWYHIRIKGQIDEKGVNYIRITVLQNNYDANAICIGRVKLTYIIE